MLAICARNRSLFVVVMDRDFIYICSCIFNYLWGLFYCAQGIGAAGVNVPLRLMRGTRAVSGGWPSWYHCT